MNIDFIGSMPFENDLIENKIIPIFMFILGLGIFIIWITDILRGKFNGQGNFFKWREGENMLWPHFFAEFITGGLLIIGAAGLFFIIEWSQNISLVGLGALIYSSINSSGWVLAEKIRIYYGIPMWIGLTGSIIAVIWLII